MVLRLAMPRKTHSAFYGLLMDNEQKKEPEKKVWRSREIFGDGKLVFIEHEDATYRLMITKQGKLILNK